MTPVTEASPAVKIASVKLTERINRIEPSATMAVVAEADKLRQQGIDVVDFGAGEPHFSTPQHVKDAAIAAIQNNFSKYTAVGGTIELRDAIIHRHAADFGSAYKREETMASTGGKHVLFNAIQVLVDHGDEVILPVPYWVSFKDIVRYAGGNCVLLETDEAKGFRVTAEMIERLVTPRTKLIILNSPSNPSGAVMSPEDLTEVVAMAAQRGIWVISDECYVYLNYTGKQFSVGSLNEYRDWMVIVGSLSKTYAMTGWRLGYALAPGEADCRDAKAAKPIDFESYFDRAKSRSCRAKWSAAMRGGYAPRVHQAARPCGERTTLHPGRKVHAAGRRVLRISEYFFVLRKGWGELPSRSGRQASARGPRRHGTGRRLWNTGAYPYFLRHFRWRAGPRFGKDAQVLSILMTTVLSASNNFLRQLLC